MKNILKKSILQYHSSFSEEDLEWGLDFFEIKSCKAKDLVLTAGQPAKHLFFTKQSISRCYSVGEEGEEHTLWMKPEQTFITEYKSFVSGAPSSFSLQFYEDTEAIMISRENLLKIYRKSQDWALFGIHLTEALHVTLIDVFVNLLANNATENYRYIEYMFPRFIQVAPLKDIASMLQISPVSLSRIRAGTQTKG